MAAAARNFVLLAVMLLASSSLILQLRAADADPLQDFCVADFNSSMITLNGFTCKPANEVQASDFKSELLQHKGNMDKGLGVAVNLANAAVFPGLNTQGLSIARIDFQPKGLNPPHVHPRATEVLYLVYGTLKVGFVTATSPNNTLFEKILYPGDLFVFPRGLVHFQLNTDKKQSALAISALNSQNPGTSQVAAALFAAYPPLPEEVLETTFGIGIGIGKKNVESLIASVGKTLS